LVIDCTVTGAEAPTGTTPTVIRRVALRGGGPILVAGVAKQSFLWYQLTNIIPGDPGGKRLQSVQIRIHSI
jgi:hypothetical protein